MTVAMLTWDNLLAEEKQKPYFRSLLNQIEQARRSGKTVYPSKTDTYAALDHTPYADVKAVIIGQDPYHGTDQAHGLSFSVKKGVTIPPSLRNIYKELHSDLGIMPANHGNLTEWAKQGVLLLNASLTVEAGKAGSHAKLGWQTFTDHIISSLNHHPEPIVFLLWGSHAQKKGRIIDRSKHHVLECAHPSPLSAYRGFFGCKHFSKANTLLIQAGREPINWQLSKD